MRKVFRWTIGLVVAAAVIAASLAVVVPAILMPTYKLSPEEEAPRRAALDQTVDTFDAESLGEVLCGGPGGYIGTGNGLTHTVVFAGTEAWPAIVERLEEQGFGRGNVSFFDAEQPYVDIRMNLMSEDAYVTGSLYGEATDDAAMAESLAAEDCAVGDAGFIYLQFGDYGMTGGSD